MYDGFFFIVMQEMLESLWKQILGCGEPNIVYNVKIQFLNTNSMNVFLFNSIVCIKQLFSLYPMIATAETKKDQIYADFDPISAV